MEARRAAILQRYREELEAIENPIVRDQRSTEQTMAQADAILGDVLDQLRQPGEPLPNGDSLSRGIGSARAAAGLHPSHSLRAADILFGLIVTDLRVAAREQAGEGERIPEAALLLGMVALHQSISGRVWRAANSYCSSLLDQVRRAEQQERRRLRRDLHDRVAQSVAAVKRMLEARRGSMQNEFQPIQDVLDGVLEEIRVLTADLRAANELDSLEVAMRRYLTSVETPEIRIDLVVNGSERWAPPHVRDETFLILREAVHNALKHADCHHISLGVDIAPRELHITAVDDGKGFVPDRSARQGTGTAAMRERAELLNGSLRIDSAPGRGTAVELFVPLGGGNR